MCHIIGINVISKPTSLKNCFKTSNLVEFIKKGTDLFNINLVALSSCRLHTYGPQFYYSPALLSLVDEAFYIKCLPLSTCSLSVNTFLPSLFTLKGKKDVAELWLWRESTSLVKLFYFGVREVMQNPAVTLNRCGGAHVWQHECLNGWFLS